SSIASPNTVIYTLSLHDALPISSFKHDRPSTLQSAALCPKLQHKQTNLNLPKKEGIMTQTSATQPAGKQAADKNAIRPFQVNFPEAELTELRRRINATKWPERETVTDASQGVQLATVQALARYWATEYDWRKIEAKMNS